MSAQVHSQLDLEGGEHVTSLTTRQHEAWRWVVEHQPCSAGELGAFLHERRGCKWCKPGRPCRYIADEGNDVLRALRAKGLVRQKRGTGWESTAPSKQPAKGTDPATSDFPEGF